MVSTPKPPDPKETAEAQAGMNRDTALQQQQINMVNQQTPWGSLNYNQTGTTGFKDSNGKWVETPTYTATTTLSPEQQKILDQTQGANLNLATLANERSNFLKGYLSQDFDVNAETEKKLYDLGSSRLDPRFAADEEGLRTRLANQGVQEGSAAWNTAMNNFQQSKNDAYNQLALNGRQQAFQEASYERALPLNEISSLLSGSQVQAPQFTNTPQASVGGVDYSGMVNSKYQADVAQSNATMGGLFGLLGTVGTAGLKFSDRRLKTDIRRVGKLDNGLPVYAYRMKGSPVTELGLMADDVETFMPSAVFLRADGFNMVDYRMATEVG